MKRERWVCDRKCRMSAEREVGEEYEPTGTCDSFPVLMLLHVRNVLPITLLVVSFAC